MVYDGSDTLKADQLSRMLEIKVPPFVKGRISPQVQGGVIIEYDEEWTPLNRRVLREHELIRNVEGTMILSTGESRAKCNHLVGSVRPRSNHALRSCSKLSYPGRSQ
jgi:hypothetical protein